MKKSDIVRALAVTAEVCGTTLSAAAAELMARDLQAYPAEHVLRALERCRRELTGRLTLASVLQRIDDGHPGSDEAWALCPREEGQTVVWTAEIAQAWGIAARLLSDDGGEVAARMAFRDAYARLVQRSRSASQPAAWGVSLGSDRSGRVAPLVGAVEAGRLPAATARALLSPDVPGYDAAERALCAAEGVEPPRLASQAQADAVARVVALARPTGGGT